ncbi:interferon-inducible GTPase-domain-containing protein [Pisolithus croceorrhizus]|nr:interferon-inducible GTPase-domain-containing protein [Pisolithus croceorrhizus]
MAYISNPDFLMRNPIGPGTSTYYAIASNPPPHPSTWSQEMPEVWFLPDQRRLIRVPRSPMYTASNQSHPPITFSTNGWPGARVRDILNGTLWVDTPYDTPFLRFGWRSTRISLEVGGASSGQDTHVEGTGIYSVHVLKPTRAQNSNQSRVRNWQRLSVGFYAISPSPNSVSKAAVVNDRRSQKRVIEGVLDKSNLRHMGNVQSAAVSAGLAATVRTARAVLSIVNYMTRSFVRDNPRLRNIINARSGAEYMRRMVQAARDEAEAARLEADQARRQAAAALYQAEEARRRAQEAILQLEQLRRQVGGEGSYDPHHRALDRLRIDQARIGTSAHIDLDSESSLTFTGTGEVRPSDERSLAEIESAIAKAEEEAEAARQVIREERERARAAQDMAERVSREAAEKARIAKQAQEEAEANLRRGIQPVIIPTAEEVAAAKSKVQYQDNLFHFAIAGVSGSGKSSLINAFRGLRNKDVGAAATGIVETTSTVDRYPDPNPRNPFVWYDIPGAGTLQQSDWLYFNSQGLFVFDCIIVLFDARFTTTDIAILKNCQRFQIPTYIVRSKADTHIRNIMRDIGYDSSSDDRARRTELYNTAREQYIKETRATVQRNLREADLPDQKNTRPENDRRAGLDEGLT